MCSDDNTDREGHFITLPASYFERLETDCYPGADDASEAAKLAIRDRLQCDMPEKG